MLKDKDTSTSGKLGIGCDDDLNVGDEVVNAEDHTTICVEEEPVHRRNKTEYAQREREREAQSISLLRIQQLQKQPTTTNLYKRLQSHFI